MIDPALQQYIEEQIVPRYLLFDKAHNIDHVRQVMNDSLQLATHYPQVNLNMVLVIAAYHDLGLCEGRELHHIVSARICRADTTLLRWFDPSQIETMCDAIEDHRASSDHAPRTLYGMLVAEADRVISPSTTLLRTVQYGLAHHPQLDREGQYARFKAHLERKYAQGGYLKLWIPHSPNAARLEELRALIADEERLRPYFDTLYNQETAHS